MLREGTIAALTNELAEAKKEHDRLSLTASKALYAFAEARAPIVDSVEKDFMVTKNNLEVQTRYVKRLSKLLKQIAKMKKSSSADGRIKVVLKSKEEIMALPTEIVEKAIWLNKIEDMIPSDRVIMIKFVGHSPGIWLAPNGELHTITSDKIKDLIENE